MSEINLSEWNLARIEAEQKKHRFGLIAHGIPQVDLSEKSIEDLDSITTAIEVIAKKATEEQELFIICEIAKLYIESQRPAEWIKHSTYKDVLICSHCNHGSNQVYDTFKFCPNCGRRMKHEAD